MAGRIPVSEAAPSFAARLSERRPTLNLLVITRKRAAGEKGLLEMFALNRFPINTSIRTAWHLLLTLLVIGLGLALPKPSTANNPILAGSTVSLAASSAACPFCSAINMTFWEQIKSHDAVVIAKLITLPPPVADIDAELPKAEFEVVRVLRGAEHIEADAIFRVLLVGEYPVGQEFVVMGVNPPGFVWSTPLKATSRVVEYVDMLGKLPEKGPDRLNFFQKYFEDEESVLAFDAYDEFARAPYEDVLALKDRMDHDQLVKWILNPETSVNRRRLYFTMLGVCGGPQDVEMLERLIRSDDRKEQAGLDALVSCYLKLKGPDGLALIEDEFLKNDQADYVDTLATISALRFHGSEEKIIPRDRLVAAVRTLLDRPKMADMVIPDLARWEDWSVMEKLVELFKNSTEETIWVRVPVIQYLQVCPKPEAKKYIEELRKIDPDAVARAALFNEIDLDDAADEEGDKPKQGEGDPGKDGAKTGGKDGNPLLSAETDALALPINTASLPTSTAVQDAPASDAAPALGAVEQKLLRVPFDPAVNLNPNLPELPAGTTVEKGVSVAGPVFPKTETLTSLAAAPVIPVDIGMIDVPGATNLPIASAAPAEPIKFQLWRAIVLPVFCGCLLFALLWSVINGWFERLIF